MARKLRILSNEQQKIQKKMSRRHEQMSSYENSRKITKKYIYRLDIYEIKYFLNSFSGTRILCYFNNIVSTGLY